MDSVGKYQIVHPDGTKLSPVDMATLAEMVYAGIVQTDTQLFAVATSRTIKAGDIPYLAFLISRLKDSPSAPPPRLPVTEPPRSTPLPISPRPVQATPPPLAIVLPDPPIPEPLHAAVAPPVQQIPEQFLPELSALEPQPAEPISLVEAEPLTLEPAGTSLESLESADIAESTASELAELLDQHAVELLPREIEVLEPEPVVELAPLPEPVTLSVIEPAVQEESQTLLAEEPVLETLPPLPTVAPEPEPELAPEALEVLEIPVFAASTAETVSVEVAAVEAPATLVAPVPEGLPFLEALEESVPVLETATPEQAEAEPLQIEVVSVETPLVSESPPSVPPVTPEPEPEVEIPVPAQEVAAPEPPQEYPWEKWTTDSVPPPTESVAEPASAPVAEASPETVTEPASAEKPEPEPKPEAPPASEAPPKKETPAEAPPEQPKKPRPKLPWYATSPQGRFYGRFGIGALAILGGIIIWQQFVGVALQRDRMALVGAWGLDDGTWLVFKEDGTGALTRPDPVYGNRVQLFRWDRQGKKVMMTESRILLPGGTRQTAQDALEDIAISEDGRQLHILNMDLTKAK